jgi:hypothetical protein
VAETRAELDGAAVHEAAQRAVTLWPEEPDAGHSDAWSWRSQTGTGGEPVAKAEPDRPGAQAADTDPPMPKTRWQYLNISGTGQFGHLQHCTGRRARSRKVRP